MPKMKSHRGARKRFRKTGDGKKVKRASAFRRHILTKKTTKRKRQLRKGKHVVSANSRDMQRLLPY